MAASLPPDVSVNVVTPREQLVARLCLVAAAVLWSTSSFFMRMLRDPTGWGYDEPLLSPLQIAFYRALFAGVVLLPIVPWRSIRFRPSMLLMVGCFAALSGLYLSALGLGLAANAILLQNTAPVWVYILGVYILGDPANARDRQAILVGLLGAIVLVAGNSLHTAGPPLEGGIGVLVLGILSGVAYASVIVFLRFLRHESPAWLTVLNMLGSAACIGGVVMGGMLLNSGPAAALAWLLAPSPGQVGFLIVFGALQMAAPYWLFTRGLRTVSPQEAGIITLLEPVLNPIWAYLIAPDREVPTVWTGIGGSMLLAALVWRYLPRRHNPLG